jgi:hypothetical protein
MQYNGSKLNCYHGIRLKGQEQGQQQSQDQPEAEADPNQKKLAVDPQLEEADYLDLAEPIGDYGTWRCKKCNYKDDKDQVFGHIRRNHRKQA